MSEILVQDTTIAARDGYALAATVFVPPGAPDRAVLINSATAVPRKIYRGFAGYLASQGFAVVTYEALPRDVFLEWTSWVMKPRYFFDDVTLQALENFPHYRGALRAICLTDDPWATPPAVDLLCAGFTNAQVERVDVRPADVGVPKIGHFGFFRPAHRDTLWRDAAEWLGS
jgi:predicted alpha/beta hydrolase